MYLASLRAVNAATDGRAGSWQVVTLIVGSKQRSLLMAGDDEMFIARSFNVNLHQRQQNSISWQAVA